MNAPPLAPAVLGPIGLLPGAPELAPTVSGPRARLARATVEACRELAAHVVATAPARLVVVSSHAARRGGAFGVSAAGRAAGDLSELGAPEAAVDLPVDSGLSVRFWAEAAGRTVATWDRPPALDPRTTAALAFLAGAGWSGPTTVLSLPLATGAHELSACGRALGAAAGELGGRTAALAVGEGCRRLHPDSPAGHHPEAALFDRLAVRGLLESRAAELPRIDPGLRELALETLIDPTTVLLAALRDEPCGTRLLSYQDVLGVGHLVALLHDDAAG